MPGDLKPPASELVRLLVDRGLSVATAEATTGGLIGHHIVSVPGSSAIFRCGVAPYSNAAKVRLGIPDDVLREHGAVSREAAEALAVAARSWSGADVGIGETGIAGPTGGADDRPVGLFWIAVSTEKGTTSSQFVFGSDRAGNHRAAAEAALTLTIEVVRELPGV